MRRFTLNPAEITNTEGWQVPFGACREVQDMAANLQDVGLEEVHAVILALADLGYLEFDPPQEETDDE